MNWLDISIVLIVISGGVLGFITGFLWQIARIIGVILAFFVTVRLYPSLNAFFSGSELDESMLQFLSYLIIFTAVYGGIFIVTYILERLIKGIKMKIFDRILGAFLGFIKAVILCAIVLLGFVFFGGESAKNTIANSTIGSVMYYVGKQGEQFMPPIQRETPKPSLEEEKAKVIKTEE